MKKISSFIPKHVANKKDIVLDIENIIKDISSILSQEDFQVVSLKDGVLLMKLIFVPISTGSTKVSIS